MTENPFFETWGTPFGLPPFDRISPEHFPPAFDRAMAEQDAEIAGITASPAAPTFANTIEALERSGRLLDRVSRVFFNLDASNTNAALEAIARDYAPKLAQHQTGIALNERLFERISELHAQREALGLAVDQLRLLDRHHLRLVRSGALLRSEQKSRMAAIAERLAVLHTLFGQNVLHDERDWQLTLDEVDLDGASGLRSRRRSASGQRPRARRAVGRDSCAIIGRAVSDILVAPRPAPELVGGMDRARHTSGGQ